MLAGSGKGSMKAHFSLRLNKVSEQVLHKENIKEVGTVMRGTRKSNTQAKLALSRT
ncbi:hypothetical protein A2U01_0048817 [Trifolium medium]|uniref:Uncharacterized protein n=1 Tax=Trifolium medium TaxID=97028 RepID=A0A392QTK0_9FABA|nr:hypothetical protein [Trifolium medium]